jgi:hypothetical protein
LTKAAPAIEKAKKSTGGPKMRIATDDAGAADEAVAEAA